MTRPGDDGDRCFVELLESRFDCLERLTDERLHKPALVDCLGVSRSTIDRAIRRLEAAGYVRRTDDGYTATLVGREAVASHRTHRRNLADLADAEAVLAPLAPDGPIGLDVIARSESVEATEPTPYEPRELIAADLEAADRCRIVLPTLPDPKLARLLHDRVVTDGCRVELLVSNSLLDRLREEFPVRLPAIAERDGVTIREGSIPEYGLVFTEGSEGPCVSVLVFASGGSLHGILRNDTERAVAWARSHLDELAAAATDVTDRIAAMADTSPDGGSPGRSGSRQRTADPMSLASQGFVSLDTEYFVERRVAEPTTAWRTGPSLTEVHAGYAIERAGRADRASAAEETSGDGLPPSSTLSERLLDRLRAGHDCALVGPSGSGKSTTCKQAAVRWYRDGGTVLYRPSGRGNRVTDVDGLVRTIRNASGPVLVVVEDAVRPDAMATFEAMVRLADDDGVSFLVDARENEWTDPPSPFSASTDRYRLERMETITMPGVEGRDLRRLAERVESTVGRSIDVPIDRLGADDPDVDGMVRPIHRLLRHVDPTAEELTTLRAAVEELLADRLDAGRVATDVAVAVNLLNVAGIDVDPALVYAVDADHEAVAEALRSLRGRVVFPSDGGPYRAVHDAWSAAFLAALIDEEGDAAAERVGRIVTRIASLADDPERRHRVLESVDDGRTRIDAIDDAPTAWADDVVERLFGVGIRWPKLAALFGEPESDAVTLPDACSPSMAADCRRWRGDAWFEAGNFENAAAEFERLRALPVLDTLPPERARTYRAHADRGLGNATIRLGDLDRGRELLTAALAAYRELDDPRRELRCLNGLGVIAATSGDSETALDRFSECVSVSEEIGVTEELPKYCNNLGTLHRQQGDLEAAETRLREALSYYEERGETRTGSACDTRNNLALVGLYRCDFETAEGYLAGTLEIADAIGARMQRATALVTKAHVLARTGAYDEAVETGHEAVELARETGNERKVGTALYTLGRTAFYRGEYDDAISYATESLEIRRDIGERHTQADSRLLLGRARSRTDEHAAAAKDLRTALETYREIGDEHSEAEAEIGLGELAVRRNDLDAAHEWLSDARERAGACGDPFFEAEAEVGLASVAAARDDHSTAVERLSAVVERTRELGAMPVAVDAVGRLVDLAIDRGDAEAAAEWCRVGAEIATDRHRPSAEAFRERAESLASGTVSDPDVTAE